MAKAEYLKNKDLLAEIIECKANGKLSNTAVSYFSIIAEKLATKLRYKVFEDKQDCVQSGIMDAIAYWKSFNPDKSNNAFSYFTMIILHGMTKTWNKLHPIKLTDKISISETNGITNI